MSSILAGSALKFLRIHHEKPENFQLPLCGSRPTMMWTESQVFSGERHVAASKLSPQTHMPVNDCCSFCLRLNNFKYATMLSILISGISKSLGCGLARIRCPCHNMATPPPPGGPSLAALNTERDISQGVETESSLSTPSHFTSKEALGTESRPVSRERQPPPPESHEAGSPSTDEEGLSHQMEQTTIEQNQNTQDIAEPSITTPTPPPVLGSTESQGTEESASLESFRDPSPPSDVRSNTIPQEEEETEESTSLPAISSTQPAASHSRSERTARNRSP